MEFTRDWFSLNAPIWKQTLNIFKDKPINVIEIGSFEGRSTVWLFENILTNKQAHLDSVDPYLPYLDKSFHLDQAEMDKAEERFYKNTEKYKDQITTHKIRSFEYLKLRTIPADLIYIDGDHTAQGALIDGVQSHLLLKQGGIIIFDDYLWAGLLESPDLPKPAIDAFTTCFAEYYKVLSIGYQLILMKK
jgi:predicted O-methyltransferase YrrM